MKTRMGRCFSALVLLLFARSATPGLVWAQVYASISGNVVDASGAAVRGAAVTVKSLEMGATRVITTGDTGAFRAMDLAVGSYEVRATKSGFKTEVRSRVSVVVGQEAVVNLRLEVGELTQEVTVVEETPIVNATTSSVAGIVGEREVKDLP
jgi:hypothetical protein